MSVSIGQRHVSTPTSAHQPEPVGRARANAGTRAREAHQKLTSARTSAAQQCMGSLSTPTTNASQGLQNVKSQTTSGWTKGASNHKMLLNPTLENRIGFHRTPETFEMAVLETFNSFETFTPVEKQSTSLSEMKNSKQPPSVSFIDPRDVFYTAPPVAQKIEILEMPKPQKAVFKNTQPASEVAAGKMSSKTLSTAPELAAEKLSVKTVRMGTFDQLAQAKMPTQSIQLNVGPELGKMKLPG